MEVEWDKDRIERKGFFLSVYHLSLIVLQHLLSVAIFFIKHIVSNNMINL